MTNRELTAADLTAIYAQTPHNLDISTLQLRTGDRMNQSFSMNDVPGVRTVEITGRSGGQVLYGGAYVDAWFVHGVETGGKAAGRRVCFTATDHMRWNVVR